MLPGNKWSRVVGAVRLEDPRRTPETDIKWSLRADTAGRALEQPRKASLKKVEGQPDLQGQESGLEWGEGLGQTGSAACVAEGTLLRGGVWPEEKG